MSTFERQAKILVVDDEVKNVKLLEALLLPRGYEVVKAYDGEQALQQVREERPDLVILDVMMPRKDGFEVCKALKDDPATRLIPVVIMTALGQVEHRVRGIQAGADDFLTKPVHVEELMARIGTSLRLKQAIDDTVMAGHVEGEVFRHEGDTWTIAYENKLFRLKDALGVRYVAHLLRHPGEEFHVAELARLAPDSAPISQTPNPKEISLAHHVHADLGHAGEKLDPRAKAEYRRRLEELSADLEQATEWGDSERAAKLRQEIEFVTNELAAAFGLGGRARKDADTAERLRKAVASRIKDTLTRIQKHHPGLGAHLRKTVRTGVFCTYSPARSVQWKE